MYSVFHLFQWDLVCQNNYLAELTETLSMLAALIAELMVARVVDRFGRKYVHHVGMVCFIVLQTCVAWAPNLTTYMIFRPLATLAFTVSSSFSYPYTGGSTI